MCIIYMYGIVKEHFKEEKDTEIMVLIAHDLILSAPQKG